MAGRQTAQKDRPSVTAMQPATPARRPSRGPVDAAGKRHRTPPAPESIDTRMGEPRGKRMGHKSVKAGWRGGR